VESDGFAVSAFWRVRTEGLIRVCRVLLAEIRTNCLRVWAGPLLPCAFLRLSPSGSGIKRVAGGGRGRTHSRGGEGGCLPERCRTPQGKRTPLHLAALRGRAAIVKLLLAVGTAVDAEDEVSEGGAHGLGRAGGQNTALRVLLFFLFCASQNLGSSSLPGLIREVVTLLRLKRGNVTDSSANHPKEILCSHVWV